METYDISGLPPEAAVQYIRDITVYKKTLETKKESLTADLELWKDRAALAEKSLRTDLATAALGEAEKLQGSLGQILGELDQVQRGLEIMKEQLQNPALASAPLRDKAEGLLLELEELTGIGGSPLGQSREPWMNPETGSPVPQAPRPTPGQVSRDVEALTADKALMDLKRSLGLLPPEEEKPMEPVPPEGVVNPSGPVTPESPAEPGKTIEPTAPQDTIIPKDSTDPDKPAGPQKQRA